MRIVRARAREGASCDAHLQDPTHDDHRGSQPLLGIPNNHCGLCPLARCHIVAWSALLDSLLRIGVDLYGSIMWCVEPPENRKEYKPGT